MSLEQVRWGIAPPARGSNARTGNLLVTEVVIAAKMRPGIWGSYDFQTTSQSSAYCSRLRDKGCDAVSRGNTAYFRWPE